ncbi:MAG: DNA mismatch repair protein MutL [Deltaproteobacteria bacterium]|nr:MAG: DNA mismatch repair protein MutL [Deltaproteobacteria bacterium]
MSRIRILSEQLANQIAAGEVVERPASVVKELVENSVDAGATRIDVAVEKGGVRLVRVVDNGCGMIEDDVLLCLERHATSKLRDESQLAAIATLGFRGEAIPSIGSVSQMMILSRAEGKEIGTRVEVRYGRLHKAHEDGCGAGTVMEVRNLFGNVPARKKFLKSIRTEIFHIDEVVKNQALASPETGFTLTVDGRMTLNLAPGSALETRVRDLYRYKGELLSLEHNGAIQQGDVQVSGYLLLPEAMTSRSSRLRVLVNGRAVTDRMIRHAVAEGLQSFLMKGCQPAGAIMLVISPDMVDVNVHPAKREIKFRNSNAIHRVVVEVVQAAMRRHQEHQRNQLFATMKKERVSSEESESLFTAEPDAKFSLPAARDCSFIRVDDAAQEKPSSDKRQMPPLLPLTKTRSYVSDPDLPVQLPVQMIEENEREYAGITYIGSLFDLYLLCEKMGRFVVIDQHAAHERILYGQLKKGYMEKSMPSQQLLFPVTVELGAGHLEVVERHAEKLQDFGLEAVPFGEATWVIKAVPAAMSALEPALIFEEILEGLQGQGLERGNIVAESIDHMLATMACRAAVKGGDRLEPEEIIGLLQQMEESEIFSHCPHGRPVMKSFSAREIEKWFHRH